MVPAAQRYLQFYRAAQYLFKEVAPQVPAFPEILWILLLFVHNNLGEIGVHLFPYSKGGFFPDVNAGIAVHADKGTERADNGIENSLGHKIFPFRLKQHTMPNDCAAIVLGILFDAIPLIAVLHLSGEFTLNGFP